MKRRRSFRKSFKRRSVRGKRKFGKKQKYYTISRGGIRL